MGSLQTFHKVSYVMPMRYTDSEIIDLWLQSQSSPATMDCYRRDAERLLNDVRKPLNRIGLGDLHRFAQSLVAAGLAPVSRARTLAAIKSLFGFCQRMRFIAVNPAAELPLPRYEAHLNERILPEEAVQRVLEAPGTPRDHVLLQTLYVAGLRVSEACGLRWRNLNARGDAGQVTVFGKNGRTRAVALPPELWNSLNKLRKSAEFGDLVFASRSGQPLDRGRVRVILREAARNAGVADKTPQISPHWLRHAHASHALDHGAPIHLVQATLGHSSVATTSAYLHARPGDSSARFLNAGSLSAQFSKSTLPLQRTRVMDVMNAVPTAQGDSTMTSTTEETKHPGSHHPGCRTEAAESQQEGHRRATEARRCARQGEVGEEGHLRQESAQSRQGREDRQGCRRHPRGQQDGPGPGATPPARRRHARRAHEGTSWQAHSVRLTASDASLAALSSAIFCTPLLHR